MADPTEQHNLLFSDTAASRPDVAKLFANLKTEIARLQREYRGEGQRPDPRT